MPAIFKRVFRVRHYECDMYGHLNNVNYVRYMQETALDASAAVGWDTERYRLIGHQWLIRETEIEYLQALVWNDEVEVTTYVIDFRRVQSRRRYEFRRVSDQELVAQADSNWVYLNSETLKPASIPTSMVHDFAPDGLTELKSFIKFPDPPRQPDGVFRLRKRAEWRDIDTVGHVNNAAYMAYCEDAATQVGHQFNWTMQAMLDEGFALIFRRFRIQYLKAAVLDDEIEISTWASDVKRASGIRHFDLIRVADSERLARAFALVICLDMEKQRPMRIPQNFLDAFAANIVSPDSNKNK